eukprot:CAMPEP_0173105296 /NCGR_PEP_ID=MMETSP1102-20130122/40001_1 /TAXON_ID=49646 /ORGANISM="Geminigera sp., Strain Caron Lab Isolate" /LENGTH=120 /DNA_ID=CAMNT_0014001475 /DNA_START=75 /DNA_END=437 /DNA_ORIENTATION=-
MDSHLSDLIRSIDNLGNFSHWYGDDQRAFTKSIDPNGNLEISIIRYASLPSVLTGANGSAADLPTVTESPSKLDETEDSRLIDNKCGFAAALKAMEKEREGESGEIMAVAQAAGGIKEPA